MFGALCPRLFIFLLDGPLPVIEDILLCYHHENPEGEGDEHGGHVPVFQRLTGGGEEQHEDGDHDEGEPHEPLFYHFHCFGLLSVRASSCRTPER